MDTEHTEREERCPTPAKSDNDLAKALQAQSVDRPGSHSGNAPVDQSETMPRPRTSPGIILFAGRVPFFLQLPVFHLPTRVSLLLISNLLLTP